MFEEEKRKRRKRKLDILKKIYRILKNDPRIKRLDVHFEDEGHNIRCFAMDYPRALKYDLSHISAAVRCIEGAGFFKTGGPIVLYDLNKKECKVLPAKRPSRMQFEILHPSLEVSFCDERGEKSFILCSCLDKEFYHQFLCQVRNISEKYDVTYDARTLEFYVTVETPKSNEEAFCDALDRVLKTLLELEPCHIMFLER